MKSLQKIMGTVSGNMQNAEGVPLSFNSEQEADFYANTTGIPDGTEIKISGITGIWTNE